MVSIASPSASGTIYGTPTITYTVTFSEFINPVTASNFTNAGTAPFTIGTVTRISGGAPAASVYTVQVIPSGSGTVQLEVQGTVEDPSSNPLAVPVTDTVVYTLDTGTEPARETVTLDGSTTSNSTSGTHDLVFDASASDKVVVIVTGENGNPGSLAGKVNSLTYDGVAMTKAVGRFPIGSFAVGSGRPALQRHLVSRRSRRGHRIRECRATPTWRCPATSGPASIPAGSSPPSGFRAPLPASARRRSRLRR